MMTRLDTHVSDLRRDYHSLDHNYEGLRRDYQSLDQNYESLRYEVQSLRHDVQAVGAGHNAIGGFLNEFGQRSVNYAGFQRDVYDTWTARQAYMPPPAAPAESSPDMPMYPAFPPEFMTPYAQIPPWYPYTYPQPPPESGDE